MNSSIVSRPNFRQALRVAAILILLSGAVPAARAGNFQNDNGAAATPVATDDQISIQLTADAAATNYVIRAEFDGNVIMETDDQQRKTVPMSVKAEFDFTQTQVNPLHAVRQYRTATANIELDGNPIKSELASERRQLAAKLIAGEHHRPVQYFPEGGILKQEELDLLTIACDPLAIPGMINTAKTAAGQTWRPESSAVQAFLALDSVIENQISIMVKEATSTHIKVYLTGQAIGEVDGAYTELRVVGIALLDPQGEKLNTLRLNLDENRDPSQLTPGFLGKARLEVRRGEGDKSRVPATPASVAVAGPKTARLLWNTDSEFELVYDPRWKIIISDPEAVVLRFGERGTVLAQCNVVSLPKLPADRMVQLEDFRKEVEKIVGESDAKVTQHDVFNLSNGCRVMRIVVMGEQDEVPIAWLYYTVNHPQGQRVALIFTVEQSVLGMFDAADQRLVQGVRFVK